MQIGVPTEIAPGERRVAIVPETVGRLAKIGVNVTVQRGAGDKAAFLDAAYEQAGATIAPDAAAVYAAAELIVKVQRPSDAELDLMHPGQALLAFLSPLGDPASVEKYAQRGLTALSMDAIPRTERASMDALSSQANIAGYKAAMIAAEHASEILPDADHRRRHDHAGQSADHRRRRRGPAGDRDRRRLGAVVSAYDTRPSSKNKCRPRREFSSSTSARAARAQAVTRESSHREAIEKQRLA